MALDAVTQHHMTVIAQVTRKGQASYRAILLTRKTGERASLQNLLSEPEQWRLAHGEKLSVSGFIVPRMAFFLPHHIEMETRFRSEFTGTHQATALAVANDEADVATNNDADFEQFSKKFPAEAARLQVIWKSGLIPNEQIVIRGEYSAAFQKQARDFFVQYARGKSGPKAEHERAVLKSLLDLSGFVAADNRSLIPVARFNYELERQNAMEAQWVNEAARQARLRRIESAYAGQLAALGGDSM
jgi:phosphonate transport system substrate-binding protein